MTLHIVATKDLGLGLGRDNNGQVSLLSAIAVSRMTMLKDYCGAFKIRLTSSPLLFENWKKPIKR